MGDSVPIRPSIAFTGNKREVAAFFEVSPQAVDGWIARGCPAVERAAPGKAWLFDLRDVAKWRYGRQESASGGDQDPASLPPKERLDWYRSERERTRHLMEMRELIPAREFETGLADAFKAVAVTLESLPDVLERDCDLTGPTVERVQKAIDTLRDDLYQRMVDIG